MTPEHPLPLRPLQSPPLAHQGPPAPGLWLLALMLLMAAAVIGVRWHRRHARRRRVLAAAKRALQAIASHPHLDHGQKTSRLGLWLRQVAVSLSDDPRVAGLTGQDWLAYLDKALTGAPFATGAGQLLLTAPYQKTPPDPAEFDRLLALCQQWLKVCHHIPPQPKSP